ncbi:hypothetical protein C8Q80DRAFT_1211932 [Daedaleopsis nitida]|nr:hypothetical protein C8Q80DRAFT_1211932 [Daedaleopsis nitida]
MWEASDIVPALRKSVTDQTNPQDMARALQETWEACCKHVAKTMRPCAGELSTNLCKAIFASAALWLRSRPEDLAHWAIWGKNCRDTMAQLVDDFMSEWHLTCSRSSHNK